MFSFSNKIFILSKCFRPFYTSSISAKLKVCLKRSLFEYLNNLVYHSLHFCGLTIGESAGQLNSLWKSSELERGPRTRNLPGECGSPSTWPSRDWSVCISHQTLTWSLCIPALYSNFDFNQTEFLCQGV